MLIKETNQSRFVPSQLRRFRLLQVLFCLVLFLVIVLISICFGMVLHKVGLAEVLNKIRKSKLAVVPNYFRGLRAKPAHLTIDIKHMNFQKLAYQREVALAIRHITQASKEYVPATIRYKDETLKARIRLKGDAIDHLFREQKWSFRIKISGDNTLFGMKRFSIHHPQTRNYLYEWLFHQALKREGVLVPRYEFIRVTLNGKDWGIYAFEEHFEKRLIEYNEYREGPIMKFNEDIYWTNMSALQFKAGTKLQTFPEKVADVDAFRMNTILNNPILYKQFVIGKNLLELFRNGSLPTHKVFDVEKLATYIALSELLGALHGISSWHNLRFYYNPVTSLLEPIGFDAYEGDKWKNFVLICSLLEDNSYVEKIFSDIVFLKKYMQILDQISKKSYLDGLFENIGIELKKNLDILYSEFPYYRFSKDVFYRNQETMAVLLNPFKALHAYFYRADKTWLELEIGNIQGLPVEVLGILYKGSVLLPVKENVVLLPRNMTRLVDYRIVDFSLPDDFRWEDALLPDLKVKYRLLGTEQVKYEKIFPYAHISRDFINNDFVRQNSNIDDFEFLSIAEVNKEILLKSGNWTLDKNLIIPQGYTVICPEGVRLEISDSAKILSYSPFEFRGTEAQPIYITSSKGDSQGQGLIIIKAGQKSVLEYVIFENLANPQQKGWELTGAITFYESPVEIKHCEFLNNRAEDSLNIIRSDFLIDKSFFKNNFSDAFDADFCLGEITDTSFIDCVNDAIDVSGSSIKLRNIFVKGIGDKGVSVGENSKMTINRIEVKNAKIAFASKDKSELYIEGAEVSDCEIGFAVYKKKPEFGPARIKVKKLTTENITTSYLVEEDSELDIDGERAASFQKNLRERLY